jgi:hypothetical protein
MPDLTPKQRDYYSAWLRLISAAEDAGISVTATPLELRELLRCHAVVTREKGGDDA